MLRKKLFSVKYFNLILLYIHLNITYIRYTLDKVDLNIWLSTQFWSYVIISFYLRNLVKRLNLFSSSIPLKVLDAFDSSVPIIEKEQLFEIENSQNLVLSIFFAIKLTNMAIKGPNQPSLIYTYI